MNTQDKVNGAAHVNGVADGSMAQKMLEAQAKAEAEKQAKAEKAAKLAEGNDRAREAREAKARERAAEAAAQLAQRREGKLPELSEHTIANIDPLGVLTGEGVQAYEQAAQAGAPKAVSLNVASFVPKFARGALNSFSIMAEVGKGVLAYALTAVKDRKSNAITRHQLKLDYQRGSATYVGLPVTADYRPEPGMPPVVQTKAGPILVIGQWAVASLTLTLDPAKIEGKDGKPAPFVSPELLAVSALDQSGETRHLIAEAIGLEPKYRDF